MTCAPIDSRPAIKADSSITRVSMPMMTVGFSLSPVSTTAAATDAVSHFCSQLLIRNSSYSICAKIFPMFYILLYLLFVIIHHWTFLIPLSHHSIPSPGGCDGVSPDPELSVSVGGVSGSSSDHCLFLFLLLIPFLVEQAACLRSLILRVLRCHGLGYP